MLADLKYAGRMLLKSPGFTLVAVLTLSLGIGANSAIFSVIDAVLLRPLPFPHPQELVAVWSKVSGDAEHQTSSHPDYIDLREQTQTLAGLMAFTEAGAVLGTGSETRELIGLGVTSDMFSVLGVRPFLGRAFTRVEDAPDTRVVVISYDLWRTAFNRDRNIIGRKILLSLRPYTVIGVMPQGFRYPVFGPRDYYTPLHPLVPQSIPNRGSHFLRCIGRLKPNVSVEQSSAEMATIGARLLKQYPDTNTDRSFFALSLQNDLVGDVRPALLTMLAGVVAVLLIACANVANLLLARATARRREIAIRTALGASRARVMRQLMAEGFLLALLGGAAGLVLAWWGVDLLRAMGPRDLPRLDEVAINGTVVFFSLGATVLSTLLFATLPALQVARPNVSEALQEGNRSGAGPESQRARRLLVIAQVALAMLLLAGAGLLIKSFDKLRRTNPGFDPERVMTFDFSLPRAKYSETAQQLPFFEEMLRKLTPLPGLDAVGGAMPLPFSGNDRDSSFWIDGRPDPGLGHHPDASHLNIIGQYFRAMRIPLLAGRAFDERDSKDAKLVMMVNDAFVQKFFPGQNPLGQSIRIDGVEGNPPAREIVGVVGSTRHESLAIAPLPEFYIPLAQEPGRRMNLVFRTSATKLAGLDPAVRRALHEIDSEVYVPALQPLPALIDSTLAQPRFQMLLLGAFAGIALLLAAVGIYGVIAYSVAQRTREIGIRMALGAQRRDMLRMVLGQSVTMVAIGLAAGLAGAFALTRLMSSLLYGVGANDLSTYASVVFLLGGTALLASYIPARRAMKVDPMVALRYE